MHRFFPVINSIFKDQPPYAEIPPIYVDSTRNRLTVFLNNLLFLIIFQLSTQIRVGELAKMLSFIMQQSQNTEAVPIDWRKALVIRFRKIICNIVRSISLTSFLLLSYSLWLLREYYVDMCCHRREKRRLQHVATSSCCLLIVSQGFSCLSAMHLTTFRTVDLCSSLQSKTYDIHMYVLQ